MTFLGRPDFFIKEGFIMKKYKINKIEIFANSLHDALEVYKSKAKDSKVKDDWAYDFSDKIKDMQIFIKVIADYTKKVESHPDAIDRIKHYLNNIKKYCDDAIVLANQFSMK